MLELETCVELFKLGQASICEWKVSTTSQWMLGSWPAALHPRDVKALVTNMVNADATRFSRSVYVVEADRADELRCLHALREAGLVDLMADRGITTEWQFTRLGMSELNLLLNCQCPMTLASRSTTIPRT